MVRKLALLLLSITLAAQAESPPPVEYGRPKESPATTLARGFASFILTPVYGAFKLTFAGLGLITGGAAYIATGGDRQVAQRIIKPAVGGTYIITPDHLSGRRPVRFVGDP